MSVICGPRKRREFRSHWLGIITRVGIVSTINLISNLISWSFNIFKSKYIYIYFWIYLFTYIYFWIYLFIKIYILGYRSEIISAEDIRDYADNNLCDFYDLYSFIFGRYNKLCFLPRVLFPNEQNRSRGKYV